MTLANGVDVPSNVEAQVTAAVQAQFATLAKIGQTVYASTFVCPVGALGSWARIIGTEVNGAASQAVGINQFPALGTVTVTLV